MTERVAPLRFGTSGWRGVLGEEFTHARLRALCAAVAQQVRREAGEGARVIVGHDSRFGAARAAEQAAEVLAGAGLSPQRARGALPTPVLARAVWRRRAAAGLIVTASHNPPEWLGVKLVAPHGGGVTSALAARIGEDATRRLRAGRTPPRRALGGRRVELLHAYHRDLLALLDRQAIRRARPRVLCDALHGTAAGVLDVALARAGARVTLLRGERDPLFGGGAPDPTAERLAPLARALRRERGAALGLATDGDGDRLAAVDASGRVLDATCTLALLVDHLARSGRLRRGIALSWATGSLVEDVARGHGLSVSRHPVGFKHFAPLLAEGRVEVAGEESGGFALGRFGRDKDGILAGALLVELVASSGDSLAGRLRALERAHGKRACDRSAVPASDASLRGLRALHRSPPARFGTQRVLAAERLDGLRLRLADGFVLWRGSGTEPLIRIYAEAPSRRRLAERLARAARLLARAGAR